MNRQLENILEQVNGNASSLEIFTRQAIHCNSRDTHKQRMLEASLATLDVLTALCAELKSALEVKP